MNVKNLIDTFFRDQHNIDRILYDPQDVDLDLSDNSQNLRKVYEIMKDKLSSMNCFEKYKSYTSSTSVPVILRDKEVI